MNDILAYGVDDFVKSFLSDHDLDLSKVAKGRDLYFIETVLHYIIFETLCHDLNSSDYCKYLDLLKRRRDDLIKMTELESDLL